MRDALPEISPNRSPNPLGVLLGNRAIGHLQKESVTVKIVDENDPHPDFYETLNAFSIWVVDLLDLGSSWLQSEVESVDAGYENIDDEPILSIRSIVLKRESMDGEIIMKRSIKTSRVCADDIPPELDNALEKLWLEAWLYATGKKSAQAQLFEIGRFQTKSASLNAKDAVFQIKMTELVEA